MTEPHERLPYWPAALNQKMAAAYCGISVDLFKEVCPIRPIQFTKSTWGKRYLRQRLDEWMVSLDPNKPMEIKFEDFFSPPAPKPSLADRLYCDRATAPQRMKRRRKKSDT